MAYKWTLIIIRSRILSAAARESCRSDMPCFLPFYYSLYLLPCTRTPTDTSAMNVWSPRVAIVRARCVRQKALPVSCIIASAHMCNEFYGSHVRTMLLSSKKKWCCRGGTDSCARKTDGGKLHSRKRRNKADEKPQILFFFLSICSAIDAIEWWTSDVIQKHNSNEVRVVTIIAQTECLHFISINVMRNFIGCRFIYLTFN